MRLDEIDQQIVAHLLRDGRASYRTVGGAVGLSAPAVKRRLDRLVETGVIEGFTAVVDARALGWTTEAFIELYCEGRTTPERIRAGLSRFPEVVGAYTVTGDADALVHLRTADTTHLEQTLERVRDEPFVDRSHSVIVLSRLLERQITPDD